MKNAVRGPLGWLWSMATKTLRRQLALGVVLVHAVLMTLFVYDLSTRQQDFIWEQQRLRAAELAGMVAVTSRSWLLAQDVKGLAEVIGALKRHEDVAFAMVINDHGRVLAHTDADRIGQFVADPLSRSLLAENGDARILRADREVVDSAVAIVSHGRTVGWARVAVDMRRHVASVRTVEVQGIAYTVVAMVIGLAAAWLLAWRLTAGMNRLIVAARQLRDDESMHLPPYGGEDEVARLTDVFVDMADRIRQREALVSRTIDELQRSNAELERFAYVASHDLQEPLRNVVAFAQLLDRRLKDRLKPDEVVELAILTDAARRMHALVRDLLAYSRIATTDHPFASVAMDEVLAVVLDNLRLLIDETGAVVEAGPLPVVMADRTQMIELLQNLIANAIKFRRPDTVPRVRLSCVVDGGCRRFAVADNGIGIDPEYAEQIFVIFKRLHTSQAYPGTGIGLAVCRRIVQRHRGRIWVEPNADGGSTFLFTLAGSGEEAGPPPTP